MQQLTNSIKKSVARLDTVKFRRQDGVFKAEGTKCVLDTLGAFNVRLLAATEEWLASHNVAVPEDKIAVATRRDLEAMSHLSTAPDVICVYEIPQREFDYGRLGKELMLCLDGVQDPGNLGTIIRSADWFGIRRIVCSKDTVDVWSPKVVMATMGALSRVEVYYCELSEVLEHAPVVYGTFLEGENLYTSELDNNGLIVLGNEGRGISEDVSGWVSRKLTIPSFPAGEATSESLNVAMATSIVVAEFRRRAMSI